MDEVGQDLSTEDGALLRELRRIWSGYYTLAVDDDGWWRAERISSYCKGAVSAPNGKLMRQLLVQDSISWHNQVYAKNNT
jgi:hypothetical protein